MVHAVTSFAAPLVALSALLALSLSLLFTSTVAGPVGDDDFVRISKRFANSTVTQACKSLKFTSQDSKITYAPFALAATHHYMVSSQQSPACTVAPASIEDLSQVMKLIASQRIEYAVQSGGHASNQGFSSTKGIHITMSNFKQAKFNADTTTVDIGTGNIWDDVYDALKDTGHIVVGGRVSGVGVGGFLTAGGGYSWYTNQYGLTADTLQSFDIVLPTGEIQRGVTAQSNPDLFFAMKGGGNQFGTITNFRLKAFPQDPQVWGGIRTYAADKVPQVMDAISDFNDNNKDPKAQIIPTLNYAVAGAVEVFIVLAFYDGPDPPANIFEKFYAIPALSNGWDTKAFVDVVGAAPSQLAGGQRGGFHTVQLKTFSRSLLDLINSEAKYYASKALLHSSSLVSYDIEPFAKDYAKSATDSAWPHSQGGLPLNLYFAWSNPADDDFWRQSLLDSAAKIRAQAEKEGQDLSGLLLYPNYCLASTPVEQMYGGNVGRLRSIRQKVDPQNVGSLTTFFRF